MKTHIVLKSHLLQYILLETMKIIRKAWLMNSLIISGLFVYNYLLIQNTIPTSLQNLCIHFIVNHCRNFTSSLIASMLKIWKQPKCPSVDEWIKQLWNIYTMEYYSAIIKKKILPLPIATVWMDLENIMLSEISQSEKHKYHVISIICEI